ncbi:hypothetical protein HZH66_009322 [Vespula vulgaris]|uniref:Uncharacterized protein n=1 Tax=Vespula vulgaris TaxID=7454 RepID=A0A834MZG6_VESVU|nr:hypothetical protein HZH66_009322 [Vespula vulgaris]
MMIMMMMMTTTTTTTKNKNKKNEKKRNKTSPKTARHALATRQNLPRNYPDYYYSTRNSEAKGELRSSTNGYTVFIIIALEPLRCNYPGQ